MFLESLQDKLGTMDTTKDFLQGETTPSYTLFTPQIQQQMKIKGIYDPLLKINFDKIFTACVVNLEKGSSMDLSNDRQVGKYDAISLYLKQSTTLP